MNPFYKLNQTLANIGKEHDQIAESVEKAKAEVKSPARKTLEESLRSDMKALMEGQVNEITPDEMAQAEWLKDPKNREAQAYQSAVSKRDTQQQLTTKGTLDSQASYNLRKAVDAYKDAVRDIENNRSNNRQFVGAVGGKGAAGGAAGEPTNVSDPMGQQITDIIQKAQNGQMDANQAIAFINKQTQQVKSGQVSEDGTGGMNFSGSGSLEEGDGLEGIAKKHGMKYHRGTYGANMSHPTKGYVDINRYGEWSHHKQGNEFSGRGHGASTARGDSSQHFSDLDQHLSSLSEGEKWIQKATKPSTKGNLHKALHVPQGETIPKGKINKATHSKDAHLRHMAQFAKNVAKEDGGSEMECNTPAPSKGIPGNVPLKDKMKRLNKGRDYYEADESDEDIMDYLNRKLAPHDKEQAKEDAISKPYNGSAGDADAYNGMEFEGNAFTGKLKSTPKGEKFSVGGKDYTDTSEIDETMTRQHFQHTADLLKHIEDPAKRMELAKHHAGVFKASNPRFDHGKFMKACNCEEGIAGQAAGTIAGGALGGPGGAAIGGAIGNNLTNEEDFEEGWDDAMAAGKAAANQKPAYSRHTRRDVAPGRAVYTRNLDDEPEDDDDKDAPAHRGGKPRGRGRPVGTKGATGSRGPTGKSKLMARDAIGEENVAEVCHHCGQAIQEKAVSKKQQKFMGMVHAAQKGEKPASKEVAKVAKGMKKKDAEDFASTKHKGLPEKVKSKKTEEGKGDGNLANNAKPYDKVTRGDVVAGRLGKDEEGGKKKFKKEEKVDETTTSGSVATAEPKASKSNSMGIGQGIYDSWNRSIESMISENINVNTTATKNDDGQDHESLTITVDGDDVGRFKELLQHMGISQNQDNSYKPHSDEPCGTCGGVPCQCEEIADEGVLGTVGGALAGGGLGAMLGGALGGPAGAIAGQGVGAAVGGVGGQELTKGGSGIIEADAPVSQNSPDYPTNQEESDDALQYSGGLNGKKSTGQSTIPVLASQEERQMSESNSFLDLYKAFSKIGK
jgi:hypothetical protein